MASSGGGGNARMPATPQPAGPIADYGTSTDWNPSYTSVLGPGWATPDSIDAGLAAGPKPINPVAAPGAADGGASGGYSRALLAALMAPRTSSPQQLAMARMSMMPGFQSSGGLSFSSPAPLPRPAAGASSTDQLLYQLAAASRAPGPAGAANRFVSSGGGGSGSSGGGGNRGGYSSSRSR